MSGVFNLRDGWFRVWSRGPGLTWKNGPALFSERYGYQRPILRIGSWRLFRLDALSRTP